jgi:hypothetical protein
MVTTTEQTLYEYLKEKKSMNGVIILRVSD